MKALIVTYYRYPQGDAGAVRQHSFAKLLTQIGYDVTVIGMGDADPGKVKQYDGIDYVSFRHIGKLARFQNILCYKKELQKFLAKTGAPDVILFVGAPYPALRSLKKYAGKNAVKLLHDSVEWYSPEEFRLGEKDPSYIEKNLLNTKWIDASFRVIGISTLLEKHFAGRGCRTARIPVILDVEKQSHRKNTDAQKTVLLYAGSPGLKDCLKNMLEGCALLSKEQLAKLEIRLLGISENQLGACGVSAETVSALGSSLRAMGRVPREAVLENLEQADFTMLLRHENLRYAQAGFPTKVAESLASATPVICNLSSDLSMYLQDGENALICEANTSSAFAKAVARALQTDAAAKKAMCSRARETAEQSFDYRRYQDVLTALLSE